MLLELKNICFNRNNKQILDNINLTIDAGQFVAITGPNGSGKSTLAKIIMGILKPDSGQIIFNGKDITSMSITDRANEGIGFAFQQSVRFKGIKVKDLIDIAAKGEVSFSTACKYLSEVGLCAKEYINREIDSSLSGGELKRIEIAVSRAKDSLLTIFDEPEAGIDLWSFNNLIDVFSKINDNKDKSIIIISHQERILNIADSVILLNNGRIEKLGNTKDILYSINGIRTSCKKGVPNND